MEKYTDKSLIEAHKAICEAARELIAKKNADYKGSDSDPFANFNVAKHVLKMHPAKGVLVRILDKISRINSFIDSGNLQVKKESWEDSIKDIINYLVIIHELLQAEPKPQTETVHLTEEEKNELSLKEYPWHKGEIQ